MSDIEEIERQADMTAMAVITALINEDHSTAFGLVEELSQHRYTAEVAIDRLASAAKCMVKRLAEVMTLAGGRPITEAEVWQAYAVIVARVAGQDK